MARERLLLCAQTPFIVQGCGHLNLPLQVIEIWSFLRNRQKLKASEDRKAVQTVEMFWNVLGKLTMKKPLGHGRACTA